MHLARFPAALTGLFLVAGMQAAVAQTEPKAPACIVVSGGSGVRFAEPRVEQFWMEVNREITHLLVRDLEMNDYARHEVFEEIADRGSKPTRTMVMVAQTGCAYLLQVGHDVNEDAGGKFFAFDVSLMRLADASGNPPKPGIEVRGLTEFQQRYRHARDPDEMARFNTATQANEIFKDLLASGKLKPALTGILPPLDASAMATLAAPPSGAVGDASQPVDPKLVARAYDIMVEKWPTLGAKDAHVRHILLASESDARAAIARVQGGEDFASVARALSADQASRDQGGDLGWNALGAFPTDVARAVKSLEPKGLASQPVHSALGWEVVEVLEVRPAPVPSFEQVRPKLEASLRAKLAARAASAAH